MKTRGTNLEFDMHGEGGYAMAGHQLALVGLFFKGPIVLKQTFFIQERFNKLIYGINTIIQ